MATLQFRKTSGMSLFNFYALVMCFSNVSILQYIWKCGMEMLLVSSTSRIFATSLLSSISIGWMDREFNGCPGYRSRRSWKYGLVIKQANDHHGDDGLRRSHCPILEHESVCRLTLMQLCLVMGLKRMKRPFLNGEYEYDTVFDSSHDSY